MRGFTWRHFLVRLLFALAAAYLMLLIFFSFLYTYALLHPACLPGRNIPPGYQSVHLATADGILLDGWWKPPQNGRVVLLLAGLGGNRDSMLPEGELLARHGYGSLTLDYRSCAGQISTLGYRETSEFNAMLDYTLAQPAVKWVGALGFSVGGTVVLRGAAARPEVQAVVAEGNFSNLYDEITYVPAPAYHPQWQVQRVVALDYLVLTGVWPGKVSPVDALREIRPRPVLLVQGEEEALRTHALDQLAAGGPAARLWIVPGVGHGGYLKTNPAEYERQIVDFFDAVR